MDPLLKKAHQGCFVLVADAHLVADVADAHLVAVVQVIIEHTTVSFTVVHQTIIVMMDVIVMDLAIFVIIVVKNVTIVAILRAIFFAMDFSFVAILWEIFSVNFANALVYF